MPNKKYFWTPAQLKLLDDHYDGQRKTIDWLCSQIPYPRFIITHKAAARGKAREYTHDRAWTEEDVEYLRNNDGRFSTLTLARKLRRSMTAIILKRRRLGYHKSLDDYTARSVAEAFGVHEHTVGVWLSKGWLQASKRGTQRAPDIWYITDKDLMAFVRNHPLAFDLKKVDQLWFIDLLLPLGNGDK